MTKTKAAFCDALLYGWKNDHQLWSVELSVLEKIYPADHRNTPDEWAVFRRKVYGSQYVNSHWAVRGWVAAVAPYLSKALFDRRSDEACLRLAHETNFRREKAVAFTKKGGPKANRVDVRISLRALDKRHDWNTCK